METWVDSLNDIEVSSKVEAPTARSLPPPGPYTVILSKVEPSVTLSGHLRKEYGRPLFEVEGLQIKGPFPFSGNYKLWQRLPMTDVQEHGKPRNYLRELVQAYNKDVEFATATEAFTILIDHLEQGDQINVNLGYYAEDYKGLAAAKEEEGLNVSFAELSPEQLQRRNELEKSSRVRGLKPFDLGDGTYSSTWTSPFGNEIPVRLSILRFYTQGYDPFTAKK